MERGLAAAWYGLEGAAAEHHGHLVAEAGVVDGGEVTGGAAAGEGQTHAAVQESALREREQSTSNARVKG